MTDAPPPSPPPQPPQTPQQDGEESPTLAQLREKVREANAASEANVLSKGGAAR
ncbi:hypothetical protein [Streptomyces litchfieldiae]|uniref:Uncharacterized protein n=1 Tax=Streptomyces litchfieldiae TaxID=3075543 RepID=A0ABU2MSP8_9ACTN|nr:hypothetical protein [Streptomyces sp. DSM 44938]MDT0344550.1 hypothetical protein [Streptomyces sp. DSM 44938]